MADDVRVTNWPSDDGSVAAATIKLWEYLRSESGGPTSIDEHLMLVRRCAAAVKGHTDPLQKAASSSGGRSGGGFY